MTAVGEAMMLSSRTRWDHLEFRRRLGSCKCQILWDLDCLHASPSNTRNHLWMISLSSFKEQVCCVCWWLDDGPSDYLRPSPIVKLDLFQLVYSYTDKVEVVQHQTQVQILDHFYAVVAFLYSPRHSWKSCLVEFGIVVIVLLRWIQI